MKTKLTLKLDQDIIEKAERYAKLHKISLPKLVENYLRKIVTNYQEEEKITPLVKSLSGIIDLSTNINYKKDYSDFLMRKYNK